MKLLAWKCSFPHKEGLPRSGGHSCFLEGRETFKFFPRERIGILTLKLANHKESSGGLENVFAYGLASRTTVKSNETMEVQGGLAS